MRKISGGSQQYTFEQNLKGWMKWNKTSSCWFQSLYLGPKLPIKEKSTFKHVLADASSWLGSSFILANML